MNAPIPPMPSEDSPTPLERVRFQTFFRAFPVEFPITVFVRASKCHVTVYYHELDQVELHASLYAAFGMRLIIERDEAGIYVVARRRRVVGAFSRSEFTVVVPRYCHLAFNLTPGHVRFIRLNGVLQVPPPTDGSEIPYQIEPLPRPTVPGLLKDPRG